ncbi:cardiolipin synthase [Staphylococcus epidermidis]|nr:cardiolipin synthase [Staphylococcus epidermidis]
MKFIFKGYTLFILLVILTIVSLFIGVSQLSLIDIFHLSDEQINILFSSRIPRTVSILLSGSSLALSGLIMQQMMQNKFVSPTTAGTMEWAKLGILMSLLFFPNGPILIKLLFAVVLSIVGTFLFVQLINLIRVKDVIFVPLLGIMIGGILSSFTTFVALRTNALQSIGNWLTGNFAKLPLINLRMNNRNHRKIVVIDGTIGYVGGFNVGDEYIGKSKKFGYWRDTHLRIKGDAVNALQLRFILDWNSQSTRDNLTYESRYFPDVDSGGTIGIQIASSGPDEDWEQIKYGYLKMISSAKESIYIQSPYFIPDQAFLDSIKIAALGGVDVNIMVPNKRDHPFVYWATLKNVASLLEAGVNVYHYDNGFLHSKTLVIDDEVASVGTANMDNRSFTLNFEVNAFIYDEGVARSLKQAFINDMKLSNKLTSEEYAKRNLLVKFKEGISQLLSPIL